MEIKCHLHSCNADTHEPRSDTGLSGDAITFSPIFSAQKSPRISAALCKRGGARGSAQDLPLPWPAGDNLTYADRPGTERVERHFKDHPPKGVIRQQVPRGVRHSCLPVNRTSGDVGQPLPSLLRMRQTRRRRRAAASPRPRPTPDPAKLHFSVFSLSSRSALRCPRPAWKVCLPFSGFTLLSAWIAPSKGLTATPPPPLPTAKQL